VAQIIKGAEVGDVASRARAATLMKDDAIGTYLIARNFKDNFGFNNRLAGTMAGWGSYYNPQIVINAIKAVYDAGIYR
jgi:hypothetical protein